MIDPAQLKKAAEHAREMDNLTEIRLHPLGFEIEVSRVGDDRKLYRYRHIVSYDQACTNGILEVATDHSNSKLMEG